MEVRIKRMRRTSYIDVVENANGELRPDRREGGDPPKRTTDEARTGVFSKLWMVVPALGVLAVAWFTFAFAYTEYLWFSVTGFQTVFTTTLTAGWLSALAFGVLAGAATYVNLRLAANRIPERAGLPETDDAALDEKAARGRPSVSLPIRKLAAPVGIVTGAFAALAGWSMGATFLRYFYQVPFGVSDPIFARDLSFYFFTLPALETISLALLGLLIVNLIGVTVVYLSQTKFEADAGKTDRPLIKLPVSGRSHLALLLGILFLLIAWRTYIAMPQLLLTNDGAFFGISYTDLHAVMPLLWAQLVVALLAAVVAAVCVFRQSLKPVWVVTVLLILTAAAGWIYPGLVQRFSVAPNELAKETPFLQHNIDATRTAFNLNNIEERELSGGQGLTAEDIRDNRRTVNNIRLWDKQPLLDTFAQIQEIRTYYEFASVDNDRYRINGEIQQVMISPREMNSASLPNRNWINEYLTFTHGYGATVGPVDKVTPEGLPELFVKNLPPVTTAPELEIDRPEIYFGELASDRVYVNTKTDEFSHPAGEQNVFRNFTGAGGMPVGTTFHQLLFATRHGDLKLLLSNDLKPESRVLQTRNIRERLEKVAPYLRFDEDPYMVISEGKLIWIADAYTTSSYYPFSQPVEGLNYIRNSVKATVDAYDGSVNLYVADETDPIIRTYARIFPGTLRSLEEMPANLRAHIRYPEDIFRIQARVFATYQMNEPQELYNKEDQWTVAHVLSTAEGEETKAMEPYYTIMKLPGEQKEEFILMLPFTPQRKDNLAAWMVARSDGENYGRLEAYRFPRQELVFGPRQIAARINQDPEISRQLALWNQRGSRVILGTLMVIPIKESLIYVQPVYLKAESAKIPGLRRVIVAHDNRIAMEETLEKSLTSLFGEGLAQNSEAKPKDEPILAAPAGANALINQARKHYEAAVAAQRAGDWARYGEEIKRLGETLEKLNQSEVNQ